LSDADEELKTQTDQVAMKNICVVFQQQIDDVEMTRFSGQHHSRTPVLCKKTHI